MTQVDKRDRSDTFRTRLSLALARSGQSQSALARAIGVDRSTISQLLTGTGARLPNAQVVGECALALGVSADWLLGLSERPENAAELLAASLSMPEAPRALVDQQIFDWHKEAIGYKIRHVPASLPDMLKTPQMLEWEYRPNLGRTTEQAIGASQDRLDFMLQSKSDFEIALPKHEITCLAMGHGYYTDLPPSVRLDQIDHLLRLGEQHYPTLRIFLFDARRVFSAPLTVFGPLLAALYIGRNYLAFRDTERVQIFSQHFDALVREADVTDRDFVAFLQSLK